MPKKTKSLRLQIRKAINFGEIDRRLRGISKIVPPFLKTANKHASTFLYDANTYTIKYNSLIKRSEIINMVGFQELLKSCSEKDIMITIKALNIRALKIQFEPTSHFLKSSIFGTNYKDIYPTSLPKTNATLSRT